jgi:Ca2+-binding EF-hand superfamily protein
LRKLAPGLRDDEIETLFIKLDLNKDGKISYEEFKRTLSYGIPNVDSNFDP